MMRSALVGVLFGLAAVFQPLQAQDHESDPSFLSLGIGAFDVIQTEDVAADFRVEYRHGGGLWIFKPWAGLEVTSDGAVFGVAGFLSDFHLGRRIVVTPSVGVGAYHDGGGLDLGSVFEIRSQLEVAYRFNDRSKLGVALSHISNAGVSDRNQGTEIISLYYSIPVDNILSP